jgi:hypothetical protein
MANKAQKMIPKHSRIEGQTIQWPIKHKKWYQNIAVKRADSGLWVHRPFLKGLCCLIFGFWCRVLWIIFVLCWPLYCLSLYTTMLCSEAANKIWRKTSYTKNDVLATFIIGGANKSITFLTSITKITFLETLLISGGNT